MGGRGLLVRHISKSPPLQQLKSKILSHSIFMHSIQEQYFILPLSFHPVFLFLLFFCCFFSSVRRRKNSSIKKPEDVDELKKGQTLIEKETMETGQVI